MEKGRLVPPLVDHPRPDPAAGIFETVLVRSGEPVHLAEHMARLAASCATLGLALAPDLELRARAAARGDGRLRILVDAHGTRTETGPAPGADPVTLRPVTLPGGLGAHKWTDRGWIDAARSPLICDVDGEVLEAGHAAFLIVEDGEVIAPPLDDRRLASVSREHTLAMARMSVRIERIDLERVRKADALVLTSALRGPHAGVIPGGPPVEGSRAAAARLS